MHIGHSSFRNTVIDQVIWVFFPFFQVTLYLARILPFLWGLTTKLILNDAGTLMEIQGQLFPCLTTPLVFILEFMSMILAKLKHIGHLDIKDSHFQSFNLLVLKLFRFVLKLVFTIYLLGVFRRNDLSKTLVTNLSAQAERL